MYSVGIIYIQCVRTYSHKIFATVLGRSASSTKIKTCLKIFGIRKVHMIRNQLYIIFKKYQRDPVPDHAQDQGPQCPVKTG